MSQEWTHKITDAFEKPKLIPEKESPIKENSNHLNDVLETMILGSRDKLQSKKKRLDKDSIFDFLSKMVATKFDKDAPAEFISQLITLEVFVNKMILNVMALYILTELMKVK